MLSDLPNEILSRVADFLLIQDIHAATLTASRFFHVFDHCLYRRGAETPYALWWAASRDSPQTARKAVEAGAAVGCQPTQKGRFTHCPPGRARIFSLDMWCTPLMVAAAHDHHRVVECLLELDSADINHRGERGVTALHEAVQMRCLQAVRLLLASDAVDANVFTDDGSTPLLQAAEGYEITMARALLASGKVEPDLANRWTGRSPLSYMTQHGHEKFAHLLLDTGMVDPDSRDRDGKTPLMWAVHGARPDCARLLLATGRVDPGSRDRLGKSPLTFAAERGEFSTAKLLLELDKVDPGSRDDAGGTPLISAAKCGQYHIVKLLLQSGKVDPDAKDDGGKTPLIWAVEGQWSHVAELLLKTGRVDPGWRDDLGMSPLMLAVRHRLPDVVKLLLGTGRCAPDLEDHSGKTPLLWAAEKGLTDIARLLLETGGADPNAGGAGSWTPLNRAIITNASGRRDGVIRLLVAHEGTDLEARSAGLTPLIHAARRGDVQLMRQLLDSGRASPNTASAAGKTALHTAVGAGREEPVRVLIGRGDVDLNRRDGEDFTPLGRAARVGCTAIAELLLRSGRISDINARCGDSGGTPLWWAAVKGRGRAARALCLHGRGEAELRSDVDGDGPGLTDGMVENIVKAVRRPYRRGLVKADAWYQTILEDGLFERMCAGDEGVLARLFSSEEAGDE